MLWFYLIEVIVLKPQPRKLLANLYTCVRERRLSRAFMHTPLVELDNYLVGKPWEFFQQGVREPYDDDGPFWGARSTLCELRAEHAERVQPPPMIIVTGLYDFFAEQGEKRTHHAHKPPHLPHLPHLPLPPHATREVAPPAVPPIQRS